MEFQFYKIFLGEQDFILINGFTNILPSAEGTAELARQVCRRHTGVGGSGLIVLSGDSEHSAALDYYSPSGEETDPGPVVLMCAARYTFDYGLAQNEEIVLQTKGGPRLLQCIDSSHFSFNLGSPSSGDDRAITSAAAVDYRVILESRGQSIHCIPVYFSQRIAAIYLSERQSPFTETLMLKGISHHPVYYRVLEKEELEIPSPLMEQTDIVEAVAATGVAAVVNGFCERDLVITYPGHGSFFFEWNERSNTVFVTATPHYAFAGTYTLDEDEYGSAD